MSLPIATEDEIQCSIIELLELSGFTVWSTSRVRRRCPQCKAFVPGGDGVDKGLPDLVFYHPVFPRLVGGIEVKGPRTAVSPEQRAAADADAYPICRSVDDAAVAVSRWWFAAGHGYGRPALPSAIQALADERCRQ